MVARHAALFGVAVGLALGCGATPRDLAGGRRRTPPPQPTGAGVGAVSLPPDTVPRAPHAACASVLVKASARTLAVGAAQLYYGDSANDGVYVIPKTGGESRRLARRAPVSGALALGAGFVTWVASPGDSVLRASVTADASPQSVRDRGIFADVAAVGEDVFIAEALGAGGIVWKHSAASATRVKAFQGAPRALVADGAGVFVVTPKAILRVDASRSEAEVLATGTRLSYAQSDANFIFALDARDGQPAIVRVSKASGDTSVAVPYVRDAPFELEGEDLLYFDADRPRLQSVATNGGSVRTVCEDERLGEISAVASDGETAYVATGAHASGLILAISRRSPRAEP